MAKKCNFGRVFPINLFRFALHVAIRKIFATFPKTITAF